MIVLAWVAGIVTVGVVVYLIDMWSYRRSQGRRYEHQAVQAAWRIHNVVTSARRKMLDEAARHRETP